MHCLKLEQQNAIFSSDSDTSENEVQGLQGHIQAVFLAHSDEQLMARLLVGGSMYVHVAKPVRNEQYQFCSVVTFVRN